MKEEMKKNENILFILKCLLFSYILTGALLLVLALLLYRFQLGENIISFAIIAIYVVSTFFAGFMTGKKMGNKKFLWGLMIGALYFAILLVVSLIVNHSIKDLSNNFITTLILCVGSGMLGGMLS